MWKALLVCLREAKKKHFQTIQKNLNFWRDAFQLLKRSFSRFWKEEIQISKERSYKLLQGWLQLVSYKSLEGNISCFWIEAFEASKGNLYNLFSVNVALKSNFEWAFPNHFKWTFFLNLFIIILSEKLIYCISLFIAGKLSVDVHEIMWKTLMHAWWVNSLF